MNYSKKTVNEKSLNNFSEVSGNNSALSMPAVPVLQKSGRTRRRRTIAGKIRTCAIGG